MDPIVPSYRPAPASIDVESAFASMTSRRTDISSARLLHYTPPASPLTPLVPFTAGLTRRSPAAVRTRVRHQHHCPRSQNWGDLTTGSHHPQGYYAPRRHAAEYYKQVLLASPDGVPWAFAWYFRILPIPVLPPTVRPQPFERFWTGPPDGSIKPGQCRAGRPLGPKVRRAERTVPLPGQRMSIYRDPWKHLARCTSAWADSVNAAAG